MFSLTAVVNFIEAQSPPKNPECGSMNIAAGHMKRAIKLALTKDAKCNPNQHCTGVYITNFTVKLSDVLLQATYMAGKSWNPLALWASKLQFHLPPVKYYLLKGNTMPSIK